MPATLTLGQVAVQEGEIESARSLFEAAGRAGHPTASPAAWLALAELYGDDPVTASDAIRQAEVAYRGAIQWAAGEHKDLRQRRAAQEIGDDARLGFARLQESQGRRAEAADLYEELLASQGRRHTGEAERRLRELDPARLRAKGTTPPPVPVEHESRPSHRLSRDLWTDEDQLERGHYADALDDFLSHDETRAPLTIGLYGPWGTGKTSLMRMLRARRPARQYGVATTHTWARLSRSD
jgi:ATPase subunit of ABC transporter with duplicated ATPase domains